MSCGVPSLIISVKSDLGIMSGEVWNTCATRQRSR
jgi:hypothetical protein